MKILTKFDFSSWTSDVPQVLRHKAIDHLESGNILFFPDLPFHLENNEHTLLSENVSNGAAKNVSYNTATCAIAGMNTLDFDSVVAEAMLKRFSQYAQNLIKSVLPSYSNGIEIGRTSYRPVEIKGRIAKSYRKDDTRLHVDAFPANPNQGRRILRVFTNINPHGQARVWRYGEPFEQVVERFLPKIGNPWPGRGRILKAFKITKSLATEYDFIMLNIHNKMKADLRYQKTAVQGEIEFAPGNTWIVQTDHVSHAALEGQYVLEQTFYLPVSAMKNPVLSPLRVLEKIKNKCLV